MKFFKSIFFSFALGLIGSGCGSNSNEPQTGNIPPAQAAAPVVNPLVDSIPDDCQIETYVGPFRGYELPFVKNGTWSDRFDYTSGLGDEIVSGYVMHRSSGQAVPNPVCEELARVLMAAPVTDNSAEKTSLFGGVRDRSDGDKLPSVGSGGAKGE